MGGERAATARAWRSSRRSRADSACAIVDGNVNPFGAAGGRLVDAELLKAVADESDWGVVMEESLNVDVGSQAAAASDEDDEEDLQLGAAESVEGVSQGELVSVEAQLEVFEGAAVNVFCIDESSK